MTQETINQIIKFRDDREWKQFHNPKDLAISISLEASELLEVFQWSGADTSSKNKIEKIKEELADVVKYYLICNYNKYDDISNYRVDRIRNIQILEEKGKPFETLKWSGHQPMNLNEYMREDVYMYSSENAFVKFRIVKAMISDVIDLFGKGVNFSEETDTHVSVSVHVNERAAEQFAKNYAPDVVILQPKRLRDKLRDDLKKSWEAYED